MRTLGKKVFPHELELLGRQTYLQNALFDFRWQVSNIQRKIFFYCFTNVLMISVQISTQFYMRKILLFLL